ncbi:MAG: hypothetical protein KIT72_18020 [Polyangiaceae bacterium]|nr:hypothetical protein [Polyangiaceae bacterium]MCW5792313.1 hypothetical protein [Polyangiaceae bacterium]
MSALKASTLKAGALTTRARRVVPSRAVSLPLLLGLLVLAPVAGCSDDGVTAKCPEPALYHIRYDEEDEARAREILASDAGAEGLRELIGEADQDPALLKQLADENCVTAPGEISTGN